MKTRRALMPLITHQQGPAFMCCDIQTHFVKSVPNIAKCIFVAQRFLSFAQLFPDSTKFITTEHYPKVFGPTVDAIGVGAAREGGAKNVGVPISKTKFSMVNVDVLESLEPHCDVVLWGLESHVCVLQTISDLVAAGKNVHVACDGTFSTRGEDREFALLQMQGLDAGDGCSGRVSLTTSEALLFQMMGDSTHPEFRKVVNLCRSTPPLPV